METAILIGICLLVAGLGAWQTAAHRHDVASRQMRRRTDRV